MEPLIAAEVTLDKTYKVGTRAVFLSLIIGEGQFGSSDVFIDDERILRTSGSFGGLRLGGGADLTGKTLLVRTIVNDTVTQTNRMTLTYKLAGGTPPGEFEAKGRVKNEGESLLFEATFALL
jgi:hypothetical protein